MAQFMGPLGLIVGFSIGLVIRENYEFGMAEKIDMINSDYQTII